MGEEKTEAPTAKKKQGVAQGRPGPADPGARRLGRRCWSSGWSSTSRPGTSCGPSMALMSAVPPRWSSDADVEEALDAARHGADARDDRARRARQRRDADRRRLPRSAQGGFFLATKAVQPKFSKLNPLHGAKRMFGPHALWEAAKVLVKSAVVALICYTAIRAVMPLIGGLVPADGHARHRRTTGSAACCGLVAVAGLVMAGADYAFQRRRGRQADPDDQARGQAGDASRPRATR